MWITDDHDDLVLASGAAREWFGAVVGLDCSSWPRWRDANRVTAGRRIHASDHCRHVSALRSAASRVDPLVVVDLDLDPLDAAGLGPRHAGDRERARRDRGQPLGRVDPALHLDRRLLDPAAPRYWSSASNVVSSISVSHFVADT